VLEHLDARSLSCLACTCRPLCFGPPCRRDPCLLLRPRSGDGRKRLGDGLRSRCRQA
jgi:hypothetical protein